MTTRRWHCPKCGHSYRWHCPKCGHSYRWHRSNTAAAHRCNPRAPRTTVLTLVDDGDGQSQAGDTPSATLGGHRNAGATLAKPPGVTGPLGGPI